MFDMASGKSYPDDEPVHKRTAAAGQDRRPQLIAGTEYAQPRLATPPSAPVDPHAALAARSVHIMALIEALEN